MTVPDLPDLPSQISQAHLFRYLDEQCFRYNKRNMSDGERFLFMASQVINGRLTYDDELIGKTPRGG